MADFKYDWELYLNFVSTLLELENIDEQTKCRVAISRAYYAAFHFAKEFLNSKNAMVVTNGAEHEKVCTSLMQINKGNAEFKSNCHSAGNMLNTLKRSRINADYKSDVQFTINATKREFEKAKKIIEKLTEVS